MCGNIVDIAGYIVYTRAMTTNHLAATFARYLAAQNLSADEFQAAQADYHRALSAANLAANEAKIAGRR